LEIAVDVRLKEQTRQLMTSFERRIVRMPEVVECCLIAGEWDYTLRVMAGSLEDYQSFQLDKLMTSNSEIAAFAIHHYHAQSEVHDAAADRVEVGMGQSGRLPPDGGDPRCHLPQTKPAMQAGEDVVATATAPNDAMTTAPHDPAEQPQCTVCNR